MRRLAIALALTLVVPTTASAHLERPTTFPDPVRGAVPSYRTSGPQLVVCRPDSPARIARLPAAARARNEALLGQCGYQDIQAAVDAAANGTRILVLPGVYREEPSRASPSPDLRCAALMAPGAARPDRLVATYEYQLRCPNDHNLVAVVGDTDLDGFCDTRCGLQIEGTGAGPADVLLEGDRRKLNMIRGDRADGLYLANFTVQYSDFNNVYLIETNGFHVDRVVSRWSREYGFLLFTTDNGLIERSKAYGNGDSGFYPGSGPEGRCARYGIEIRNVESYGNLAGYSGTAGNGVWVHDSRFHDNAVGLVTDSAVPGHPGMPQDCARFERNHIYSNNQNPYLSGRRRHCAKPYESRDPNAYCPIALFPWGTGLLILGGNDNLVSGNRMWNNLRSAVRLYWVPAFQRGDLDPALAYDTSHGNRFVGNRMGVDPSGRARPNGVDFWWDEEGRGNCWSRNGKVTSDPKRLPPCPSGSTFHRAATKKFQELVLCGGWRPARPEAPGCPWLTLPKRTR